MGGSPSRAPTGAELAAALGPGSGLPAGHRLVTPTEEPEIAEAMRAHGGSVWAAFMHEDPVATRLWHHLYEAFASYQGCLLDPEGRVAATLNSAPLRWNGSDDDLPDGWDDQFERSVADLRDGRSPDTLGALLIVVAPARQGDRLSGLMLEAMKAMARLRGHRALIACVRPTLKERYPLVSIDRYAAWTREDGLPFDPWIRVHVRLGGRIVRGAPRSMTMTGSVAEWESWTGMAFPESGDYVVPRAASPVHIDREADVGTYHDPNVWVVHPLARSRATTQTG
jgi:GNAT superfamily N-acetyltransferase